LDFLQTYLLQEIHLFDYLDGFIYFVSGILASILLALSIYAYRKKYVKKILYANMAFTFFTSYLFFEALEVFYPVLESLDIIDIGAASITTLVVIFFFLAIVKK
jgi:phosphoglycerol transferase MdoB-like AlkP superfamily enzyme